VTFTEKQQKDHRTEFIRDCYQKAWGAACNADWIAGRLDKLLEEFEKLNAEDRRLEGEIKGLETGLDYHTVENRNQRKALQERRNVLAKQMEAQGNDMQQGQAALQNLYQNIETNLALAKHSETWEWKEVGSELNDLSQIVDNHVKDAEVGDIVGPTIYRSLKK
jgi:paraquat-inducible protein B